MVSTKKNEEAVSPVIGVILMVAVTVILAGIVAYFVFGMAGSMQSAKTIGVTAKVSGTSVNFTYAGGPDDGSLEWLKLTAGTVTRNSTTNGVMADAGKAVVGGDNKPAIGTKMGLPLGKPGSAQVEVIAVAHWSDGTETVVLDTKL